MDPSLPRDWPETSRRGPKHEPKTRYHEPKTSRCTSLRARTLSHLTNDARTVRNALYGFQGARIATPTMPMPTPVPFRRHRIVANRTINSVRIRFEHYSSRMALQRTPMSFRR